MGDESGLRLEVIEGPRAGRTFPLAGGCVIGRSPTCDVPLLDESASREHARLETADGSGSLLLRDLDSRNGTRLNGRPVAEATPVSHGDEIGVGSTRLVVVSPDALRRETRPGAERGEGLTVRSAVRTKEVDLVARPTASEEARRLQLLLAVGRAVARPEKGEPLVDGVLEVVCRESPIERAAWIPAGREADVQVGRRVHPSDAPTGFPSRWVVERVLEGGEGLLVDDAREDARLRDRASVVRSGARSIAGVPVEAGDRILGVLYADGPEPVLDRPDLEVLVEVGRHLGQALVLAGTLERQRDEVRWLRKEATGPAPVGESPVFRETLEVVERAAASTTPILLRGETGTGKEVLARWAHRRSPRADGPFIATNCAALPPSLVEATLFGHEKGAYTGADRRRRGCFEQADGGTLFLDEVGEIPLEVQAKLLRVVETHEVRRLGAERTIRCDFRLLAATNRDLRAMVEEGTFREDLRYRLAVVEVTVPPLRERAGDVDLLADHLLAEIAARLGRPDLRIADEAREALRAYPWPGNIRELNNVLERAVVLAPDPEIGPGALPPEVRAGEAPGSSGVSADEAISIAEAEKRAVRAAMRAAEGVKKDAAEILGVSRPTLNKKLRDYGLE